MDDFELRFVFVVPSKEIGRRLWENRRSVSHYPHHRVRTPGTYPARPELRDVPGGYMVVNFLTEEERDELVEVSFFRVYQRNSFLITPLGIYLGR